MSFVRGVGIITLVAGVAYLAGSQFTLPVVLPGLESTPFVKNGAFPAFYAPIGAMAGYAAADYVAGILADRRKLVVAVIILVLILGVTAARRYEILLATAAAGPETITRLAALFATAFFCFFFLARMAGVVIDRTPSWGT